MSMSYPFRLILILIFSLSSCVIHAAGEIPDLDDRELSLRADLIGGLATGSGLFIAGQVPDRQPPLFAWGLGVSADYLFNLGVESYLGPRFSVGLDFQRRGFSLELNNDRGVWSALTLRLPLLIGLQFSVFHISIGVAPELQLSGRYTASAESSLVVPNPTLAINLPLIVRFGSLIPMGESVQLRADFEAVDNVIPVVANASEPDDTFQLLDFVFRVGVAVRFGMNLGDKTL